MKSNLAVKAPALAFRVVPWDDDPDVPVIQWEGPTDQTADDLLAAQQDKAKEGTRIGEAVEFLRRVLREGPVPATQVTEQARARGIAERTLDRAKKCLEIKARKSEGSWNWAMPGAKE